MEPEILLSSLSKTSWKEPGAVFSISLGAGGHGLSGVRVAV